MKKIFVMLSLGMLVAGTTFAQEAPKQDRKHITERAGKDGVKKEGKTPEERAAKRTEMLTKKYNLTQAQQAKVQALHLRQANETAALRADRRGTEGEKTQQRESFKTKRAQWDAELQSILTAEQYAQYQADRKEKASNLAGKTGKKGHHLKSREQKKEQKS